MDYMKDILSYNEMSAKEGFNIQRGMNFRPKKKKYSIFLMSVHENAPYNDGFDEEGNVLVYEGEDISRREIDDPKSIDQPLFTVTGKLSNNGKFFKAAEDYKATRRKKPERVRVYEKVTNNVWSDKGFFELIDALYKESELEKRKVFKFILRPLGSDFSLNKEEEEEFEFSRRIPTAVKRIVWERDKGQCIECGSDQDLHFDHIIPWSKGGSSTYPKNVQILCSKHNLSKSDKIK
ncbi:MAG: HNH endonuclease signature motif containing protein [Candidatus Paceibacterota bacterium]